MFSGDFICLAQAHLAHSLSKHSLSIIVSGTGSNPEEKISRETQRESRGGTEVSGSSWLYPDWTLRDSLSGAVQ